jgi:hypothetical protein
LNAQPVCKLVKNGLGQLIPLNPSLGGGGIGIEPGFQCSFIPPVTAGGSLFTSLVKGRSDSIALDIMVR